MRRTGVHAGIMVAFVAFGFACSSATTNGGGDGSSSGSSGTPTPTGTATGTAPPTTTPPPVALTPQAACSAYTKARCAKQKSCSAFQFQLLWGDDATCESRLGLDCVDKFAEPGVAMKPDNLEACAKAIGGAICDDVMLENLPAACTTPGTLAKGVACAHDEQCSTSYCKKGSFGASARAVSARRPAARATSVVTANAVSSARAGGAMRRWPRADHA